MTTTGSLPAGRIHSHAPSLTSRIFADRPPRIQLIRMRSVVQVHLGPPQVTASEIARGRPESRVAGERAVASALLLDVGVGDRFSAVLARIVVVLAHPGLVAAVRASDLYVRQG
jgi:hypothetical protein